MRRARLSDSALVHETLDRALAANPDAHPLFHSDRGFQYTTRVFHDKLAAAGMTQSMSRVGKCIDNGPMEGFWGILKRERYYGRVKFMDGWPHIIFELCHIGQPLFIGLVRIKLAVQNVFSQILRVVWRPRRPGQPRRPCGLKRADWSVRTIC